MQTLDNYNFAGKKAFVRVDFNVPLDENFNITDDTRMVKALPTLKKILADGGSLIIGSHLGRPKKGPEDKFSLRHIVAHLSELLGTEVKFVDECVGDKVKAAVAALKPGEVLLLENLRFLPKRKESPEDWPKMPATKKKLLLKKRSKPAKKNLRKNSPTWRCLCKRCLRYGTSCSCLYGLDGRILLSRKQNVRIPHG